ncbi:MAG: hypothetical protein NXI23_24835 [Bacteroidetes bacterium]|nr:hypothetical protein [Bacteroidota bacterium]MDF1867052.1 hypothetical protein [Saprospiraceae bacterium]
MTERTGTDGMACRCRQFQQKEDAPYRDDRSGAQQKRSGVPF